MASFVYDLGVKDMLDGTIQVGTTAIKVMLIKSTYTTSAATDTNLTALSTNEIDATNYTKGFAGAGRKAATATAATTATGAKITFTDITWTALGGATNDTVGAAVLIREVTTNADSIPIAYWDITDTPTNVSDFTLTMNASTGNITFTV